MRDAVRGPRGGRRAFTLVELLVVIAIVIVLVAILLPVVGGLRLAARDMICTSRLRDLSLATASYLTDHGSYPEPPREAGPVPGTPSASASSAAAATGLAGGRPPAPLSGAPNPQVRVLNALGAYLKFRPLAADTAAVDLPPAVQCPSLEATDDGRGPYVGTDPANPFYYTGYTYVGALDAGVAAWGGVALGGGSPTTPATTNPKAPSTPGDARLTMGPGGLPTGGTGTAVSPLLAVIFKPSRPARARSGADRAVLWADVVTLSAPAGGYWQFSHALPRAEPGPVPMTYAKPAGCRGQHRANTDGSIDWVPGTQLELIGKNAADLERKATFRVGTSYWWF